MSKPFHCIYSHGFIRTAVCVPFVRVADPFYNLEHILGLARRASDQQAAVALFPELGISAYSNDDLFHQDVLLDATEEALATLIEESRELNPVLLVGAPLRFEGKLFNCALTVYRGRLLGITPKTYLPNYREFYEKRQFTSGRFAVGREMFFRGERVPFGADLVFHAVNVDDFILHAEICEDVWTPISPSTYAALAGATILTNLSASNVTIGKAEYRRELCAAQSGKCVAAYLYSAAGPGESTTDVAWDGQALIYENGELLAEAERFTQQEQLIVADVDLERLAQDRMRLTSFNDVVGEHREQLRTFRRGEFEFRLPTQVTELKRTVERFPFVPNNPAKRDERCFEAYNIQVHGLMKRLQSSGITRLVIGVSGGLDSTHALIVAARTMDRLELPRSNILAYTLPGFA
ncbi:MAG: NAD(+) synthase, partial [Candidatus Competibacteraceae bacterium]|nr:NAD(+) synthase [Candidatus Competibacteraceae bacterium]